VSRQSNSTVDMLREHPPFDQLPRRLLRLLEQHVDRLHVSAGTVVARAGHPAYELVVVKDGAAVAVAPGDRQRLLPPGVVIGGRELASGRPHEETVVATSDLDVIVVNGPSYRWLLAELAQRRGSTPLTYAA
jgi:CRP-like cAMP-binding protein